MMTDALGAIHPGTTLPTTTASGTLLPGTRQRTPVPTTRKTEDGKDEYDVEEGGFWHCFLKKNDVLAMSAVSRKYDGIALDFYIMAEVTTFPGQTTAPRTTFPGTIAVTHAATGGDEASGEGKVDNGNPLDLVYDLLVDLQRIRTGSPVADVLEACRSACGLTTHEATEAIKMWVTLGAMVIEGGKLRVIRFIGGCTERW